MFKKYAPFSFAVLLVLAACSKYPDVHEQPELHEVGIAAKPAAANLSGNWNEYTPKFIVGAFKQQEVDYEIRETIVDLEGGFKYRALTYDGNFPAKPLVAEQGTIIRFKIKNSGTAPHSIHTHVIKYTPENDGAGVSQIEPGETRYFFWEVTKETTPGFYPFHDHGGDGEGAQSRGLIGMISIVPPGELANPGFGLLMHDLDPKYLFSTVGVAVDSGGGGDAGGHGAHGGGGGAASAQIPVHLYNGSFGSSAKNSFSMAKGAQTKVGVVNLGTAAHTFHPHGNFWLDANGVRQDNLELEPGGFRTVNLVGEAAGGWLYHCHIPGHPEGGMWGKYTVE